MAILGTILIVIGAIIGIFYGIKILILAFQEVVPRALPPGSPRPERVPVLGHRDTEHEEAARERGLG